MNTILLFYILLLFHVACTCTLWELKPVHFAFLHFIKGKLCVLGVIRHTVKSIWKCQPPGGGHFDIHVACRALGFINQALLG